MGNGSRSTGGYSIGGGGAGGGSDDESGKAAAPAPAPESESSYPCKKMTNFMPYPSPYYHHNQYHQASAEIGGHGLLFGNPTSSNNQIGISSKPITGKVLFTASQWQELERQTMIYKYIMASIPVPPQLLIQSNRSGMDLRFSNGSDPEPWRCRRTDGKKWRCSRDVAPEQKYCERHAHKSRPRSRKPVETTQSHNTKNNNSTSNALNNKDNYHPVLPPAYMNNSHNNSDIFSADTSSYQQPRSSEWFMRSGTIPVSSSSQQFQQEMHSPKVGSKRDHIFQDFEENNQNQSHFNYNNDLCSLTLSMQSGGNESFEMDQGAWMGAPPGGPLGEALCLGMASHVNPNGPLNEPSAHGYSNSTTTSGSCEDGGARGLRFNR